MIFSKGFLAKALPDASFVINGKTFDTATFVQTAKFQSIDEWVTFSADSRLVEANEVFVALKGAKVDANEFIPSVFDKGVCAVIMNREFAHVLNKIEETKLQNKLIILVSDTLEALFSIAKAWRARITCPVVGITGSIGKTTTKEMLREILTKAGISFFASYKNQNSFVGLCLNLLHLQETHKVAVFEVGISQKGEMAIKADILKPTMGLVTCIAHSHASGLGSLQETAAEKLLLFKDFGPSDVGIVFGDQQFLTEVYYSHPVSKFGLKTKNQVQARKIKVGSDSESLTTNFLLKWYGQQAQVTLKSGHMGMVNNALAASAIAYFLEIPLKVVIDALQSYVSFENRFELKNLKSNSGRIISDCCNANPESMRAAILAFDKMETRGSKIAVIGDMLELGDKEAYWHRQIGRLLCKTSDLEHVILVGSLAKLAADTAPVGIHIDMVSDWHEAKELLSKKLVNNDSLVLVKASHGMELYKLVKDLTE